MAAAKVEPERQFILRGIIVFPKRFELILFTSILAFNVLQIKMLYFLVVLR